MGIALVFDVKRFIQDYDINNYPEGKNVGKGWIGIECPFCKDGTVHGGFNIKEGYFSCWKCGGHNLYESIKALTELNHSDIIDILKNYKIGDNDTDIKIEPSNEVKNEFVIIPGNPLYGPYIQYLINRNFDPVKLEKQYALKATGPIGDYKFRIVAPIVFRGKEVSYQARSIINHENVAKYLPCPKEKEVIHYKKILYNLDNCNGDNIIVVEGITSVWRLGNHSAATFGIQYTTKQAYLLSKFKKIFLVFDNDPERISQSTIQAKKLISCVHQFTDHSEIFLINFTGKKDPGEFTDQEAAEFKNDLFKNS